MQAGRRLKRYLGGSNRPTLFLNVEESHIHPELTTSSDQPLISVAISVAIRFWLHKGRCQRSRQFPGAEAWNVWTYFQVA
jgi:hypothetical protein